MASKSRVLTEEDVDRRNEVAKRLRYALNELTEVLEVGEEVNINLTFLDGDLEERTVLIKEIPGTFMQFED